MSDIPECIGGIPNRPVIEFLSALDRWGTWFSGFENSVLLSMPDGTTEIRARAMMKVLDRIGLVNGCHCGCRGDYEITEEGLAWLNKSA